MNIHDITKKYILSNTELIIFEEIIKELTKGNKKIPIRELASKTYVSTTVIMNLAKKLGFTGYSEMLYVFNESIHKKVDEHNTYPLSEYINAKDIVNVKILINDLYAHRNQKVYLVGVGFSDIITQYFSKRLAEYDYFSYTGAPIDSITINSRPSIVIIFSKSGETIDLIQIIEASKKMGHTIYAITASRKSTIAKLSDYHIELEYKRNKLFNSPDYYVGAGIFAVENILMEVLKLTKE